MRFSTKTIRTFKNVRFGRAYILFLSCDIGKYTGRTPSYIQGNHRSIELNDVALLNVLLMLYMFSFSLCVFWCYPDMVCNGKEIIHLLLWGQFCNQLDMRTAVTLIVLSWSPRRYGTLWLIFVSVKWKPFQHLALCGTGGRRMFLTQDQWCRTLMFSLLFGWKISLETMECQWFEMKIPLRSCDVNVMVLPWDLVLQEFLS